MTTEIHFWKIQKDNSLNQVNTSKLNLEARLEDWLEKDISVLDKDLLVIGRQVSTEFSGLIDLLCLDSQGDLVIVELKRDKTPREITAQVLDYASWVKDLSRERVVKIADEYLQKKRDKGLEDKFQEKFGTELPEVLNETHKMLVVATQIDASSERIIQYLSDTYGVGINAATFQYFKDDSDQEFLARVFLIKQSQVERKSQERATSKRRRDLTLQELLTIADENGVGDSYRKLYSDLQKYLRKGTSLSSIRFKGTFEGSQKVIFSLIPTESDKESGLKFQIYINRFANYFKVEKEKIVAILPKNKQSWGYVGSTDPDWVGFEGYFQCDDEVVRFTRGFLSMASSRGNVNGNNDGLDSSNDFSPSSMESQEFFSNIEN